jgi:hypothetical protein
MSHAAFSIVKMSLCCCYPFQLKATTYELKTIVFQVEQFVITSPHDNKSWEAMDEMIGNAEEFCKVRKAFGLVYAPTPRSGNAKGGSLYH